jgi:hypothetical protein
MAQTVTLSIENTGDMLGNISGFRELSTYGWAAGPGLIETCTEYSAACTILCAPTLFSAPRVF